MCDHARDFINKYRRSKEGCNVNYFIEGDLESNVIFAHTKAHLVNLKKNRKELGLIGVSINWCDATGRNDFSYGFMVCSC